MGPDGEPAPGVLVRGIIVAVTSLAVFVGAIFFINYTNLGKRLAFLITGTAFFGFLAVVGLMHSLYAPRGLRPADVEGLNAFELRILPGALMLGSLILFAMFLVALHRYDQEHAGDEG
ncbi:MAG: sugar transferase [Actinobacteria bacterium]|nr:sugar transferase [Actinomycetota bacterium]